MIDIKNKYKDIEIFVSLNKNFLNHEVEGLKDVLIRLNDIGISGVFFYDLVVLQLKKELIRQAKAQTVVNPVDYQLTKSL